MDREINEAPTKSFSGYAQWIMMQFSRSIKDRCQQANTYRRAKKKSRGYIHLAMKQLNKQDTFIHEMTNTLFYDFMQINISDKNRNELIDFYTKISNSQQSILKKSSELLSLLKELEKEPFNMKLVEKIKLKELEVTNELSVLQNEVVTLGNKMKQLKVLGNNEMKNFKSAVKDIETYNNELNQALKNIEIEPKVKVKPNKKRSKVHYNPLFVSKDKKKMVRKIKIDSPNELSSIKKHSVSKNQKN